MPGERFWVISDGAQKSWKGGQAIRDATPFSDREGQPRAAYSLRHTYFRLSLMEGADICQIAKNCRTSGEMIEKSYASHIKISLDAVVA